VPAEQVDGLFPVASHADCHHLSVISRQKRTFSVVVANPNWFVATARYSLGSTTDIEHGSPISAVPPVRRAAGIDVGGSNIVAVVMR
jgi:hypothetical protein